jgi:hypothetical protein
MNFYGTQTNEQHTLAGRLIPLLEALWLAIAKATGQPAMEPRYSELLPGWTHNLCAKTTTTLFKGLVEAAPRDNVVNARNYGCMIGILLRGVVFYMKEVPAILEKDGLLNLTPERESKLEQLAGLPQLFAMASDFFNKPISDGDTLIEAGAEQVNKKADELAAGFGQVMLYLLNRPVSEQSAFLDGIARGFKIFLNNDGEFAGDKRRLEAYLALFAYWPEIAEMQKSQPPKTRLTLLNWLEAQEEKQLFDDPKNFFFLCDEIGLDMTAPGHPSKTPSG